MEEDDNIAYIHFESEEQRLRYIIDKFKRYDARRKKYVMFLQSQNDKHLNRIKELEKLTEHQHEEIDELIDAYTNAKPLILHPTIVR